MVRKIYAAGGMTGLSEAEMCTWRKLLKNLIANATAHKVAVFDPTEHFSFEELKDNLITDKETMNIDLWNLSDSDLVVMNFNNPQSIGTAVELGFAHAKGIPVIGLNEHDYPLHAWQKEMCVKIFLDLEDLFLYMVKHYL